MYMDMITSTQLRSQTPKVIETLLHGGTIDLVHRSKIVGTIMPKVSQEKILSARTLQKKIDSLALPRLTQKEIDRRYRAAMMKKHGKGLS